MPDNPFEDLLSEHELAAFRGCSVRTIRRERERGEGPPFIRLGKFIKYFTAGVKDDLRRREERPVREAV